jgi:hypothetical protein
MIWQPKVGQEAVINYKDKSMPLQGIRGEIVAVGNGRGPKNALVKWTIFIVPVYDVVPRGNLNAI